MNTYSLPHDMNKVFHEAAFRRLLESSDTDNSRRILLDLKTTMEAMAAVSKAHVQFCQSTKSLVSLRENSAWMREVKVTHNHATHRAQEVLAELGDPGSEAPVLQNLATRKTMMISRDSVLNTLIKVVIVSLQELMSIEQMTRGQYDHAEAMVVDLKNQVEQEYACIASQLETMILSRTSTDAEPAPMQNEH